MRPYKVFSVAVSVIAFSFLISGVSKAQGQDYNGQEDPNKKIIKSGLLGAGVGAISASASGGSAGKGALIGAGTNIIGGALLDSLTGPSQPKPQPVYYQQQQPTYYQNQQYQSSSQPKKKIIRKYDSDGNVVSEEEVWE